jgi:hypothetical protein
MAPCELQFARATRPLTEDLTGPLGKRDGRLEVTGVDGELDHQRSASSEVVGSPSIRDLKLVELTVWTIRPRPPIVPFRCAQSLALSPLSKSLGNDRGETAAVTRARS